MRHKLVMIASQVEHFNSGDRTNVLFACECGCGKAHVRKLDGGWTADALAEAFHRDTHRPVRVARAHTPPPEAAT